MTNLLTVVWQNLTEVRPYIWEMLKFLWSLIGFTGVMFTIFDIYEFRSSIIAWWKSRREFDESIKFLKASDSFVAHIIHLGGEFSMTYSMYVMVFEDGGYYLNPPNKFVSVGFNRGGDLMVVAASEYSSKYGGFVIDSLRDSKGNTHKLTDSDICHLPIPDMKNEYQVTFRRSTGEKGKHSQNRECLSFIHHFACTALWLIICGCPRVAQKVMETGCAWMLLGTIGHFTFFQ
ncbi:MAG: hypothetical protein V4436_02585 [Patescibacteria group bacterium]